MRREFMDIGVTTRSFPELTNVETADLIAQNGLTSTELCFSQTDSSFWAYNGRSDLSEMTDDRSREIVATYRSRNIDVVALGVFTNLLEPDDTERAANLAYYERMMQIAALNGIPYLPTESGFIAGQRGISADAYEEHFTVLVDSLKLLSEKAEQYDVCVALEACVLDLVPSAKRAADLITQVDSDRIKILLDPANLIANSSEEDMFRYLAPHVAYFHGKDRKLNDTRGRIVGDGDIDWPLFLGLYHRYTEGAPFILEYVNATNVCDIRDRVLSADKVSVD
jgi:sugar phosphate isomerase/epimerase